MFEETGSELENEMPEASLRSRIGVSFFWSYFDWIGGSAISPNLV